MQIVTPIDGSSPAFIEDDNGRRVYFPDPAEGASRSMDDVADGKPVDAVAATATLTYTDGTPPTAGKLVTINGKAYKFVAGPVAAEGDILIGANADAAFTNLTRCILHTGGTPNTDWKAVAAHPTVSAGIGSDIVTLTAKVKGVAGNDFTVTTDEATVIAVDFAATGEGEGTGIDGTVGYKGKLLMDADAIYVCVATATIVDTGKWKKAALAALGA